MCYEMYLYIFPLKSYMYDYFPTAVYFIKVKRTGGLYLCQANMNESSNMTKDSLIYGTYPLVM